MSRFDVYTYNHPSVPLVLEVQADLLSALNTCAVIPLVPKQLAAHEALPKLKPTITINAQDYILMTTDISTLTRASLGPKLINIQNEHHQTVTEALDFLFQGF